jgi:hypothetical protein
MPNRIGGSLNQKDRAPNANAERCRHCGVGADRFQLVFGFHQRGVEYLDELNKHEMPLCGHCGWDTDNPKGEPEY